MEYRKDREPGEEYELVQHWAEDLELDNYFALRDEDTFITEVDESSKDDELLRKIEEDPYQLEGLSEDNQEEMRKFLASNSSEKLNLPIVVFMMDALKFFKGTTNSRIEKVAFETAMLGKSGISPEGKYNLNSLPGGSLSGNKLLAYYFVRACLKIICC